MLHPPANIESRLSSNRLLVLYVYHSSQILMQKTGVMSRLIIQFQGELIVKSAMLAVSVILT